MRSLVSTVTGSVYSSCSYCSRVPPTSKPLRRISSQSISSSFSFCSFSCSESFCSGVSSSGSSSSRKGLESSSCFRCCWRSIMGMYSMSMAW